MPVEVVAPAQIESRAAPFAWCLLGAMEYLPAQSQVLANVFLQLPAKKPMTCSWRSGAAP